MLYAGVLPGDQARLSVMPIACAGTFPTKRPRRSRTEDYKRPAGRGVVWPLEMAFEVAVCQTLVRRPLPASQQQLLVCSSPHAPSGPHKPRWPAGRTESSRGFLLVVALAIRQFAHTHTHTHTVRQIDRLTEQQTCGWPQSPRTNRSTTGDQYPRRSEALAPFITHHPLPSTWDVRAVHVIPPALRRKAASFGGMWGVAEGGPVGRPVQMRSQIPRPSEANSGLRESKMRRGRGRREGFYGKSSCVSRAPPLRGAARAPP
eukprot:364533-Chlamydomonas_euryale.AAC.3